MQAHCIRVKEKKLGRKQLQEKLEKLPTLYFDSWIELTVVKEYFRLQHQKRNQTIYTTREQLGTILYNCTQLYLSCIGETNKNTRGREEQNLNYEDPESIKCKNPFL